MFLEADAYRELADAARAGGFDIDAEAIAAARRADAGRDARLRVLT